jgi:hypothetical protein
MRLTIPKRKFAYKNLYVVCEVDKRNSVASFFPLFASEGCVVTTKAEAMAKARELRNGPGNYLDLDFKVIKFSIDTIYDKHWRL